MNIDYHKWMNPNYNLFSLAQLVRRQCYLNNIDQIVKGVTRIQYNSVSNNSSLSCIDHIYTNVKFKCSSPMIISFGDSDHDIIGFTRLSKKPAEPSRTIRKRSYKKFVKENFLADLATIDWSDVLSCPDLDAAAMLFCEKFRFVLDKHAPWVLFQLRKNFKPWITQSTLDLMKERDYWKNVTTDLSLANGNQESSLEEQNAWSKFKSLRNKVNNRKKNDEHLFKKEKVNENIEDFSKTWSTIKQFMEWKAIGTPNQLLVDNKLVKKASEVAELMNEFFISKVDNLRKNFVAQNRSFDGCRKAMDSKKCRLSLEFVSLKKVEQIIKNLKSSKAVAADGLDSYSIKISAKIIAVPIHHIITLSIMQRRFPESWKYAKVLPLHKKGCQLERKNYRPVSILSPVSKILERVIHDQLYSYFSKNKLFHPNLMGYRKNRSTLTAILQMYDRWVRGAADGNASGIVLLDLSAAFDLVNPSILWNGFSAV